MTDAENPNLNPIKQLSDGELIRELQQRSITLVCLRVDQSDQPQMSISGNIFIAAGLLKTAERLNEASLLQGFRPQKPQLAIAQPGFDPNVS